MAFYKRKVINGIVYLSKVKSVRVGKTVRHQFISYVGKVPSQKDILSLKEIPLNSHVKINANILVLDAIAKEIDLHHLLGPYSAVLLSLVYAHCLDYRSLTRMDKWVKKTNVGYLLGLKNVKEYRLLKALDDLESKNFGELQREIFSSVKKNLKLRPTGILYDVTNTYFFGKKCSIGRRGKSKEGRDGKRLIQIGLGVTQKEGITVFHKTFKGNTSDSRVFYDMITDFAEFGFRNGTFVFDRGIFSKKTLEFLNELKWKVICGVAITNPIKEIIRKLPYQGRIQTFNKHVKCNSTTFYVTAVPYKIGKIDAKLAICFDPRKEVEIRKSLHAEIEDAKKTFGKWRDLKPGLQKFFTESGRIKEAKIEEHLEFSGFSLILSTSCDLSEREIVKFYFDKDLIEKSFHVLKSIVKLRPIRHWLSNRVTAHVFICYLSHLLLSILRYKIRVTRFSVNKAIEELDMAYTVRNTKGLNADNYDKIITQSDKQRILLKLILNKPKF
jgi:transposase